ncbi:MAG: 30S ribosomal protein S16 [Rhodothermales bacterium]
MAVKIRLRRMGRKKLPVWAVVAADTRSPRDGRFIEDLGRYYPLEEPARVEFKDDRLIYWLEVGAKPTDTVRSLLSKQGVLLALHLKRKGKTDEEIQEAVAAHRAVWDEKAQQSTKLTSSARRKQALEEEKKVAAKLEAEEAAARAKAEEARKQAEEEARRQAAEEAKAKAEAEKAEAEAAKAEAEKAEAEATEAEAAPAAEAEAAEAEAAPAAEAEAAEAAEPEAAAAEAPAEENKEG